jgi:regulator of sirC expression with transglutaminase-like and TPR domain
MHSQETDLKQENEELKALVATYKIQLKQYQEAHEQMRHQLNELIRHRFGAKSEHSFDSNSPQQDLFTTQLGINTADSNVVDEDDVTVP